MTFSYPSLVGLNNPPPYKALPTKLLSLSLSKDVRPPELNVPAYFSAAFLSLSSSAFFMVPNFPPRIFPPAQRPAFDSMGAADAEFGRFATQLSSDNQTSHHKSAHDKKVKKGKHY